MTLKTKLSDFDDVRDILNDALKSERGLALTLLSPAAALFWRQRSSRFRVLFREAGHEPSPYDDLEISVRGPTVLITPKRSPIIGVTVL